MRQAIRVWARAYGTAYRAPTDPKRTSEDARDHLLRWTRAYCALSPVERAAAFPIPHPSAKTSCRAALQMATTAGCLIFRSTEMA